MVKFKYHYKFALHILVLCITVFMMGILGSMLPNLYENLKTYQAQYQTDEISKEEYEMRLVQYDTYKSKVFVKSTLITQLSLSIILTLSIALMRVESKIQYSFKNYAFESAIIISYVIILTLFTLFIAICISNIIGRAFQI